MTKEVKRLSVSTDSSKAHVSLCLRGGLWESVLYFCALVIVILGHVFVVLTLISELHSGPAIIPTVMGIVATTGLLWWDFFAIPQLMYALFGRQEILVNSERLQLITIVLGAHFTRTLATPRIGEVRIDERVYATKAGKGISRSIAFACEEKLIRTRGNLTPGEAQELIQLLAPYFPPDVM